MTDYSQMGDHDINVEVGNRLGWVASHIHQDNSVTFRDDKGRLKGKKNYCNNPADAWPIIEESKISTMWMTSEKEWCAWSEGDLAEGAWGWENVPDYYFNCTSQFRAAMVVFLMMKDSSNANSR